MLKKLRDLCDKQGWICWLCEDPMTADEASIDHILPQKIGGNGGELKAAHKICNSFRGHSLEIWPAEYYRENRKRIEKRQRKKAKRSRIKRHVMDNWGFMAVNRKDHPQDPNSKFYPCI